MLCPAHEKDPRCRQVEFFVPAQMFRCHREELGEELHVICLEMEQEDMIERWDFEGIL